MGTMDDFGFQRHIVGRKVLLHLDDDTIFDAYITDIYMGEYFSVFSLNLPTRIVVHKSCVQGDVVFIPEVMSEWVFSQLEEDFVNRPENFDA
jgi:hypothetical protein